MKLSLLLPALCSLSLLGACSSKVVPVTNPASAQPVVVQLAPDITVEIDPRLEFLAGIQTCTSWAAQGNPGSVSRLDIQYKYDLQDFFALHKGDVAVRLTQELIDSGFSWDAPPNLALATQNGLAFDSPDAGYSDYLKQRARGAENLLNQTAAWRNLAAKSHFAEFFNQHRDWYQRLAERVAKAVPAKRISQWLQTYYGASGRQAFHFVLAPAMMPNGGYGASYQIPENGQTTSQVYQIIRDAARIDPDYLVELTLHEFGHSWVNPAIGEQVPADARPTLEKIFAPVAKKMNEQAYGTLETFLNELVLRAITIKGRIALGLIDAKQVDQELQVELNYGFYCIKTVYRLLTEYETNRQQYPDFRSFGQVLLQKLAGQADNLTNQGNVYQAPKGADAIKIDFQASTEAPGPGFYLIQGAKYGNNGQASELSIERPDGTTGQAFLTLRGNKETAIWWHVAAELGLKKGTLQLSWRARCRDIRLEGTQPDTATIGLYLIDSKNNHYWKSVDYTGTQDWKTERMVVTIDPAEVRSMNFGIFLACSGELSVDDLEAHWL